MADEARLHQLLDLIEQARSEGDTATEAKAVAAYKAGSSSHQPAPGRSAADYSGPSPESQMWRGQANASQDMMHMLSNALVGIPAKGVAGLANIATFRPVGAADDWIDRNMVLPPAPGPTPIADAIGKANAPLDRAWEATQKAVPRTASVMSDTAEIFNRLLGAAPIAGAASATVTGVKNLVPQVKRLTPDARATTKASKIARGAAGESIESVMAANRNAPSSLTAGQSAHGVPQDTWQALADLAAKNDKSSFYRKTADLQEAGRQGALHGVTPDLAEALAARENVSGPFYAAARNSTAPINGQLADALTRLPGGIMKSAQELARVEGRPFSVTPPNPMAGAGIANAPPQVSGDALHYIKLALDDAGKPRLTATPDDAMLARAAKNLKPDYLKAVETAIPPYQIGRETFAKFSAPVNQSQVLKEMAEVLANKSGGERVTPFLNAVEGSNSPLLKRATGDSRYTAADLPKVLTPNQMSVVDDIVRQLKRDAEMASNAKEGAGGLARILDENKSSLRIPHLLSPKITVANSALAKAEATINRKVMDKLVEGMKSGKNANELLRGLSPVEAQELSAFAKASPKAAGASALIDALASKDRRSK